MLGRAWSWANWVSKGVSVAGLVVLVGLAISVVYFRAVGVQDTPPAAEPGRIEWPMVREPETRVAIVNDDDDDGVEDEEQAEEEEDDDGTRPVALLYCHALGVPRNDVWLQEKRGNASLPADVETWLARRCLAASIRPAAPTWHNMSTALAHTTGLLSVLGGMTRRQLEDQWAPRATRFLVDARGDIFLRLVHYDARAKALAARLVPLRSLLETLDTFRAEVRDNTGGAGLRRELCVCPLHLGIVGSGLHFTQESDFCRTPSFFGARRPLLAKLLNERGSNPYRVLVNVREQRAPGDAVGQAEVNYSAKIHPFPASIDALLWPRQPAQPRHVTVAAKQAHFTAYDPLPLFDPDVVTRYDAFWKHLKLRHPLDDQVIVGGTLAQNEAHWFKWLAQPGPRPFNLSKPLLDVSLEAAERDCWTESTTAGLQSPRCIAYCAALEQHVLAPDLVTTDDPLRIAGETKKKDDADEDGDKEEEEEDDLMDRALLREILREAKRLASEKRRAN